MKIMSTIPEEIKELSPFWGKPKEFKAFLEKEPPNQVRKKGKGGAMIPISTLEKTMDLAFGPSLWEREIMTQSIRENTVMNEICIIIRVHYLHPILKAWRHIDGQGATPIQLKSGSKANQIDQKISNALEAGWPRSGAMAFRNAVGTLGKQFGRDLGRKTEDVEIYSGILSGRELAAFTETMTATETIDEASEVWLALPEALQTELPFATTYNQHVMHLKMNQMALPESTGQVEIEFDEAGEPLKVETNG